MRKRKVHARIVETLVLIKKKRKVNFLKNNHIVFPSLALLNRSGLEAGVFKFFSQSHGCCFLSGRHHV